MSHDVTPHMKRSLRRLTRESDLDEMHVAMLPCNVHSLIETEYVAVKKEIQKHPIQKSP